MIELPTGTVTFLFTDIEESTGLVQQLGESRVAGRSRRKLSLADPDPKLGAKRHCVAWVAGMDGTKTETVVSQ